MRRLYSTALCVCLLTATLGRVTLAESQSNDYKGVQDPFGDPSNYEFSEDEKEDKEFFHLGRYVMIGVDLGVGAFTGGLGRTTNPGFYAGAKFLYFFDKSICMELAGHYANHLDTVNPAAGQILRIDTNLIPLTLGFRYYFDTKNAPKAIAIANPYLGVGGGVYVRTQNVTLDKGFTNVTNGTTYSFGGYGAAGLEFPIYRRHVYAGVDARFHFIFFPDANNTFGLAPGTVDRSGNYFTTTASITYNF
jgi:outer membrane protein W